MPRLVNKPPQGSCNRLDRCVPSRWGVGGVAHQRRFFANARPEWDLRYFSNSSARYLSGKAQYQTNSQGLNLAVWMDLPALCSGSRRFKSAVAPMYSCSGKLMLRMM